MASAPCCCASACAGSARAQLPCEVVLDTSQHSRGFFERFGFQQVARHRDGYGPGLDRCEMRLELNAAP